MAENIKKRKNILFIVHYYRDPMLGDSGGTSMHVHDLVTRLCAQYNVHVVYRKSDRSPIFLSSYTEEGKKTKVLNLAARYSLTERYNDVAQVFFLDLIDYLQIDLIHIHHLIFFYLDIFKAAELRDIPVLYTAHDFYSVCPSITLMNEHNYPCFMMPDGNCVEACPKLCQSVDIRKWQDDFYNCLKKAERIIVPSKSARDIFYHFSPDLKIDVIEHGYDICGETTVEAASGKDTFDIAFIGNISEIKGFSYLKGLISKVRNTDIVIHLFGVTRDPLYNISTVNYVYHGEYDREDLPRLIKKEQIKVTCLLATWPETFSYTLSEALHLGTPVITLDIGATAERVGRIDAGWVLPYGSTVDEVYNLILKIKTGNLREYEQKKMCIQEYIRDAKTLMQMSEEYRCLYDRTMTRCPVCHDTAAVPDRWDNLFSEDLTALDQIKEEYEHVKTCIIKGAAPMKELYQQVSDFREKAYGTKYRNKILYKFIWYRCVKNTYIKYVKIPVIRCWKKT